MRCEVGRPFRPLKIQAQPGVHGWTIRENIFFSIGGFPLGSFPSATNLGLRFPHRSDWSIAVAVTECVFLMKQDGQGLEFRMRRITLEQSQESTVIRIVILLLSQAVVCRLCVAN